MSTEQLSGEPVVLRARPTPKWPEFLLFFQIFLPLAVGAAFFYGLRGLADLAGLLILAWAVVSLLPRLFGLHELAFNEEGVELRSGRKGFLTPKPVSFRWDEVTAVRRGRLFTWRSLAIRLDRVRRFWALRPQPPSTVTIPESLWQDVSFIEAVRKHVPPEKTAPNALETRPAGLRASLLPGGILSACFLAVALVTVAFVSYPRFSAFVAVMVVMICCFLGDVVWSLAFDGPPAAATIVGGALTAMAFLPAPLMILGLINGTELRGFVAVLGSASGLLLGAAFLVFLGRRVRWQHVGLFYGFGLAGCLLGLLGWDGIPSLRVAEGAFLLEAWTPSGDGFVVAKGADGEENLVLNWYAPDGALERAVPLPILGHGYVSALGQDAALYKRKYEDCNADLFVVPRYAGAYRLIATRTRVWSVWVSPSGRRCLFLTQTDEDAPKAPNYLELPDGEVARVNLPAGHEEAGWIGILDDGRLVWVTGKRPENLQGLRMSYRSDFPPRDVWSPTYEPVKVWAWDPQRDEAPKLLYAEEHMCLDWKMPTTSSPLYLCRVFDTPEREREFVELDLTEERPEPRSSDASKFEWDNPVSHDGRFVVETYEDSFPRRMYVRNTVTGKRRWLRDQPGWWTPRPLWSPTANRFLYATTRHPFELVWKKDFTDWDFQYVVRLVDLEE